MAAGSGDGWPQLFPDLCEPTERGSRSRAGRLLFVRRSRASDHAVASGGGSPSPPAGDGDRSRTLEAGTSTISPDPRSRRNTRGGTTPIGVTPCTWNGRPSIQTESPIRRFVMPQNVVRPDNRIGQRFFHRHGFGAEPSPTRAGKCRRRSASTVTAREIRKLGRERGTRLRDPRPATSSFTRPAPAKRPAPVGAVCLQRELGETRQTAEKAEPLQPRLPVGLPRGFASRERVHLLPSDDGRTERSCRGPPHAG